MPRPSADVFSDRLVLDGRNRSGRGSTNHRSLAHRLVQARSLFRVTSAYVASPSDAAVVVSMLAWASALAVLKFVLPLPALVRLVGFRAPSGHESRARADRIISLIDRMYREGALSHDGTCLERSLLTFRFLARAHPGSRLTIGAREINGHWLGHAWVTVDDRAVSESLVPPGEFCPIVAFDANGLPCPVEGKTCPIP